MTAQLNKEELSNENVINQLKKIGWTIDESNSTISITDNDTD